MLGDPSTERKTTYAQQPIIEGQILLNVLESFLQFKNWSYFFQKIADLHTQRGVCVRVCVRVCLRVCGCVGVCWGLPWAHHIIDRFGLAVAIHFAEHGVTGMIKLKDFSVLLEGEHNAAADYIRKIHHSSSVKLG